MINFYINGLRAISRFGPNRALTVFKKDGKTLVSRDATIDISKTTERYITTLLQKHNVTDKERRELQPISKNNSASTNNDRDSSCATGRLTSVIPQVPQGAVMNAQNADVVMFRNSLPISKLKHNIMQLINDNRVTLITGDTGCGKTTQVPQFILEHANMNQLPCRIITAQPRRLAALSVAERVAFERGESIGQTVGYQIRLESK